MPFIEREHLLQRFSQRLAEAQQVDIRGRMCSTRSAGAHVHQIGGDLQEMVGLHGVSFRVFRVRPGDERKDREGIHVHFFEPGSEAAHQA